MTVNFTPWSSTFAHRTVQFDSNNRSVWLETVQFWTDPLLLRFCTLPESSIFTPLDLTLDLTRVTYIYKTDSSFGTDSGF